MENVFWAFVVGFSVVVFLLYGTPADRPRRAANGGSRRRAGNALISFLGGLAAVGSAAVGCKIHESLPEEQI